MHRSLRVALIGLLALLVLTPVSAQATDAPAESGTYTMPMQGVITNDPADARSQQPPPRTLEERKEFIPQETPEEVRERAEIGQRIGARPVDRQGPDGVALLATAADDISECQASDASRDYTGLVMGHTLWCSERSVTVWAKDCNPTNPNDCINHGTASFLIKTIGYYSGTFREVEFVSTLSNFDLDGDVERISRTTFTLAMECTVVTGSSCNPGSTNGRSATVVHWTQAPTTYFYFSSPEAGSVGVDHVSWYTFKSRVISGPDSLDYTENGFRCDSATYLLQTGQQGGCVFDLVIETFDRLSTTDPDVWETAVHIYSAQNEPELTLPHVDDKFIPGSQESLAPLSRNFHDTQLRQETERIKDNLCTALYGNYAQNGFDCDEYPMNSTFQGAGSDGHFSLSLVTARDNQVAGARLGGWYTSQRILHEDEFYVVV